MKISTKLFFGVLAIFLFAALVSIRYLREELTPRYREAIEETLVEQAQLLGAFLSSDDRELTALRTAVEQLQQRTIKANIFGIDKTVIDLRVSVTDERGIVLYDSIDESRVGRDHSQWRDVLLTLRVEYGARTTRDDTTDPGSTVLYVAAPYFREGKLAGVVTVGKPLRQFNRFVTRTEERFTIDILLLATFGLLSLVLLSSHVLTKPILRLSRYAQSLARGEPAPLPPLPRDEIGALGEALEQMRLALEGHKYVEEYIQSLTHELKSPLAGIRGAIEVLESSADPDIQQTFRRNIALDARRMQQLVDRLLNLAALEARNSLVQPSRVILKEIIFSVLDEIRERYPHIQFSFSGDDNLQRSGDPFLLEQAIRNLLENAASFAHESVRVELKKVSETFVVEIQDDGPGIPDYALGRLFERFYSLPRPTTGEKSTGLGLCFVREIARLHGGTISIGNHPPGARAMLVL